MEKALSLIDDPLTIIVVALYALVALGAIAVTIAIYRLVRLKRHAHQQNRQAKFIAPNKPTYIAAPTRKQSPHIRALRQAKPVPSVAMIYLDPDITADQLLSGAKNKNNSFRLYSKGTQLWLKRPTDSIDLAQNQANAS